MKCRFGLTKVTLPNDKTSTFSVTVPGKWILAGEHAVLRGSEALVFPLFSKYIKLNYFKNETELEILIEGQNKQELELIIWSVLEKAFKLLNLKRTQMRGIVEIKSSITLGGGMGASATLCVAITEWLQYLGHIKIEDKFYFATDLENLFHGESSGVDVAVTLSKKPLVFTRYNGFSEFKAASLPCLYLSYSGERGVTKDCIEKVKNLFNTQPELAKKIDQQMGESVNLFKKLLLNVIPINDSLSEWTTSINKSNHCFEEWGLITDNVKRHQKILLESGALAVKLTGSGGGGYVLSLWKSKPASDLPFEMIACFE